MEIQITLNEKLSITEKLNLGKTPKAIQKNINEAIAIKEYVEGELSLGEVAEIFGKGYIEMREWLHSRGIDPTGVYDKELQEIQKKNVETALAEL